MLCSREAGREMHLKAGTILICALPATAVSTGPPEVTDAKYPPTRCISGIERTPQHPQGLPRDQAANILPPTAFVELNAHHHVPLTFVDTAKRQGVRKHEMRRGIRPVCWSKAADKVVAQVNFSHLMKLRFWRELNAHHNVWLPCFMNPHN